jgi:hypothetical protein
LEEDIFEYDPVEGYCVRCRETVEFENPKPVWTRRGLPATRGECPNCAGTVFRMGKTDAHDEGNRPEAVQVAARGRIKLAQETVYVNFAAPDEAIAEQIAADLQKVGITCWLHEIEPARSDWASGVHPALRDCHRMVYLLSEDAIGVETVENAWRFFREKRKPVVIAQLRAVEPPDPLRRSPRYNFADDYKTAFRQLVQALNS